MKRQQIILMFFFIMIVGLVTLLLKDFIVNSVLIPFEQVIWACSTLIEAIPDVVWWGIFILVLLVIILKQFSGISNDLQITVNYSDKQSDSLFTWNKRSFFRPVNAYQRWKLERRVSELAIEILADENRTSIEHTKQNILEGKLELPAEVLKIIQSGLSPDRYIPPRKTIILFNRKRLSSHSNFGIEQVLDFLETRRI